jgi:hypothetical protein
MFFPDTSPMEPELWDVERRQDGAVLVRVHSSDRNGRPLPDAIFTFRLGDPQFTYWEERLQKSGSAKNKSQLAQKSSRH